jgi:hypothetical protein
MNNIFIMNNTTLLVDKEVKAKALKKAKEDTLSLSSVVRILLLEYAEGRIQIGARIALGTQEVPVDNETQNLMDGISQVWNKAGKTVA